MKKTVYLLGLLTLVFSLSLFQSCSNDENVQSASVENEISFSINSKANGKMNVQSSTNTTYDFSSVVKVNLTIQNSDGTATKYTATDVKINQINGSFFTEKIVLKTGSYKITQFLLIDANNNTIFAAPLAGSLEAQNVPNPLAISFTNTKNVSTPINVTVLSTEKMTAADFGYSNFPIAEVKLLQFMIGVADLANSPAITASLTVTSGAYTYATNLNAIENNLVSVKDGLASYILTIAKAGYITFKDTLTLAELTAHTTANGNLPILINLEVNPNITDIDGNIYHAVTIGTQTWMVENLRTSKYRDGSSIGNVTDGTAWAGLTTGGWCNYNNDLANDNKFGKLYNWYAASDSRNLAPAGWHVATIAEWATLQTYVSNNLGGSLSIGSALASSTDWVATSLTNSIGKNIAVNNSTGFNILPGGYRNSNNGAFENTIGYYTGFWKAEGSGSSGAVAYIHGYYDAAGAGYYGARSGYYVRCVKD